MSIERKRKLDDLYLIIAKLKSCASVCDMCASELRKLNTSVFASVILTNVNCAQTCRHAVYLLQSCEESGLDFLEVCNEICKVCEQENNHFKMDACQRAALECHYCCDFLKNLNV
jgi:hypothetical protein